MTGPFESLRHMPAGWRLLLCLAVGALVFVAPFPPRDAAVHAGAAWVLGILLFLGLTAHAIHGVTTSQLRKRSREIDDRAWVISVLVVIAAVISLLALALILYSRQTVPPQIMVWRLVVGGAGMICAWFLIHTVLALHYAHLYYGDVTAGGKKVDRGGLDFPETTAPDYWDFFYYAFVIGMICQFSCLVALSRRLVEGRVGKEV